MNYPYVKYSILFAFLFCNRLFLIAQQSVSGSNNVVTIIGDSIPINNIESNNIYESINTTNTQNQSLAGSENSLPLFENEFLLQSELKSITMQANTSSPNSKEHGKIKKRKTSLAERKFNFKKRFRTWIPKPKKKYRPTICDKL